MNDPKVFENPCPICKKREATQLCDYIVRYDNGIIFFRHRPLFNKVNSPGYKHETCDLPLCKECAVEVGTDADICPHHYKLYQQAELPEELERARMREKARQLKI